MKQKIENLPGFVKVNSNKAIVSTDKDALEAYKKKKRQANEISEMKKQINTMEEKLNIIMDYISKAGS